MSYFQRVMFMGDEYGATKSYRCSASPSAYTCHNPEHKYEDGDRVTYCLNCGSVIRYSPAQPSQYGSIFYSYEPYLIHEDQEVIW